MIGEPQPGKRHGQPVGDPLQSGQGTPAVLFLLPVVRVHREGADGGALRRINDGPSVLPRVPGGVLAHGVLRVGLVDTPRVRAAGARPDVAVRLPPPLVLLDGHRVRLRVESVDQVPHRRGNRRRGLLDGRGLRLLLVAVLGGLEDVGGLEGAALLGGDSSADDGDGRACLLVGLVGVLAYPGEEFERRPRLVGRLERIERRYGVLGSLGRVLLGLRAVAFGRGVGRLVAVGVRASALPRRAVQGKRPRVQGFAVLAGGDGFGGCRVLFPLGRGVAPLAVVGADLRACCQLGALVADLSGFGEQQGPKLCRGPRGTLTVRQGGAEHLPGGLCPAVVPKPVLGAHAAPFGGVAPGQDLAHVVYVIDPGHLREHPAGQAARAHHDPAEFAPAVGHDRHRVPGAGVLPRVLPDIGRGGQAIRLRLPLLVGRFGDDPQSGRLDGFQRRTPHAPLGNVLPGVGLHALPVLRAGAVLLAARDVDPAPPNPRDQTHPPESAHQQHARLKLRVVHGTAERGSRGGQVPVLLPQPGHTRPGRRLLPAPGQQVA